MKSIGLRTTLIVLIFLCASISIFLDYTGSSFYNLFKPLTTILVILMPLLAKGRDKVFKGTLIVALCFCLVGDVLLLNSGYFVFGLGAFLVAHLLFAKAFMGLRGFQNNAFAGLGLLMIGLGLYFWLYPNLT